MLLILSDIPGLSRLLVGFFIVSRLYVNFWVSSIPKALCSLLCSLSLSRALMSTFCLSFSSSRKLTFVDMTLWLLIAFVSTPLMVASWLVTLSFVSPVTDWTIGFLAVLLASSGEGVLFLVTACAYVFD